MLDALYDPQTSGGLLIAAPAADVDEFARRPHAEGRIVPLSGACARRSRAVLPSALFASPHVYVTVCRSLERLFRKEFAMSTKIEVNAMGDAPPAARPSRRSKL